MKNNEGTGMNIKQLLATTATATLLLTPAYGAIKLDELVVKGPTWNPIDSGKNSYDQSKINTFVTPNQDLNDLFRTMPNVQFNDAPKRSLKGTSTLSEKSYTDKVLDQRPNNISISGGRFYENQLLVDGRSGTSRLGVDQNETGTIGGIQHNVRAAGWKNRSSNSEWVKPFDVEKVDIYDSNIGAKYGKFSGGVVDVKTKKPTGKQGGNFYYDFGGSKWEEVKYIGDVKRLNEKWRSYSTGGRFNTKTYDLGDNKTVAFQISKNRSKHTTYQPLDAKAIESGVRFAPAQASSISKDQKVSAKLSLRHDMTLNVSIGNAKYDIDNVHDQSYFIYDVQQRLGQTASVSVAKKLSGGRTLNIAFDTSENKLNRDGFGKWNTYRYKSRAMANNNHATFKQKCGNLATADSACTLGGYGDTFEQEKQKNLSLTYAMPSKWGRLEFGGALENANLQFKRNQDSIEHSFDKWIGVTNKLWGNEKMFYEYNGKAAYYIDDEDILTSSDSNFFGSAWGFTAANGYNKNKLLSMVYRGDKVRCETESESCKNGDYAMQRRKIFEKKSVKATGTEKNAYMQLTRKLENDMTMRAGIRYDYDTLLKNSVFAPRLSLSHKINGYGGQWPTTYGLNRYYANSNATYVLYQHGMGTHKLQYRKFKLDADGNTLWMDEWVDYNDDTGGRKEKYGGAPQTAKTYGIAPGLKTPHKDELSIATQSPEYGFGQLRFKAIQRKGKNEFVGLDSNDPACKGQTYYCLTNEGWSKYRALNVEYRKTWGPNSFFANTTFSSTKRNAETLLNTADEKDKSEEVYYKGSFYKRAEFHKKAAIYNRPQTYNFGYSRYINTGNWGGVMAGITGRYTESYRRIGRMYNADGSDIYKKRPHPNYPNSRYFDTAHYVYDDIKYPSRLDLNGRLTWNIARNGEDTGVQVYTGIHNLLNTRHKAPKNGKAEKEIFRGRSFTFGTQISF